MTGRHATRLHLFARETAKLFCGTFLLRLNLCWNRCPRDSASNMWCCALMVARQCSKDCTVRTLSCVVIHSSRLFCVKPHPIPPARSELCCRFCVFEWLLAHHLARPLRQESVLVESGGSMVCASKGFGPYRLARCEQESRSSSCRLCVPKSLFVGLDVDVYPGSFSGEDSHAAAAPEFAAPVHTDKSSPSGGHRYKRLVAGRGCAGHMESAHSPHVLELSNRRLRQDSANLGRWVACWRHEAKRARADLQLAEQDTIRHGKKGYLFSMRCGIVTALRRNIECGTGAAALTDLLQIDACKQPIMCWDQACLALSSRRIHKRCDHFFGRCGQHALTLSTVTSIFMTGDASNAGLFQNSKLQTLKIVSRYCWADVQSRASAEWES